MMRSCRFSQSALSATMAAVLGSAGTHSEVEWVCMLAKFLQQSLLQPTVGFPFLWHWREGLKKKEEEGKIQQCRRQSIFNHRVVSPAPLRGSGSHLEGGDVEILPEGQTQHVEVLPAVSKRAGQRDEDYRREEAQESERHIHLCILTTWSGRAVEQHGGSCATFSVLQILRVHQDHSIYQQEGESTQMSQHIFSSWMAAGLLKICVWKNPDKCH